MERDYGTYIHSFLALVDESAPADAPHVIEQMHFNDDVYGRMLPEWVEGFKPHHLENIDNFSFFPYIGGAESDILPMWNHMLEWAGHVKKYPPNFEEYFDSSYSVNCRSGVRAALETMGVQFYGEFTRIYEQFKQSASGSKSSVPSAGTRFEHDGDTDVHQMRQRRNELVLGLK